MSGIEGLCFRQAESHKKCSSLFDRLGSGDDVDAGEFGRDLVDQALEEIRHGKTVPIRIKLR